MIKFPNFKTKTNTGLLNLIPTALAATTANKETAEQAATLLALYAGKIVLGVVALVLSFVLATMLRASVQKIIRKKQGDQHEEVCILYGRVTFTTTLCVGIMIGLTIMGAPLEWFSGGIGLGVAFSLRSFLANFFAGIVLLSNNKFNLGDFIILDNDTSGTIVDIQSRATSLRAIDGGEITVPNMNMLNANVKCYTKNPVRKHTIEIGVGYGSNLKETCSLVAETIKKHSKVQPEPAPMVLVKQVADSAVILEARFWTESKTTWWMIKSEVLSSIFDTLQASGIDIPYPVQTLRVDAASSDMLAGGSDLLGNLKTIEKAKKQEFKKLPAEKSGLTAAEIEKQAAAKKSAQKISTAEIEKQALQGNKDKIREFEVTAKAQPSVVQEKLTAAEIEKRSQNTTAATINNSDSDIIIKPAK